MSRTVLPTPPIQLVGRNPEYIPFATSQAMHNRRNASHARDVPREVFDHHEHALLERWWNTPEVTWLFAAHPPDTGYVFGYLIGEYASSAAGESPILHWLLVRRDMRGMGVARELLRGFLQGMQGDRAYYTCSTPYWKRCLDGRESVAPLNPTQSPFSRYQGYSWVYSPYLALDPHALRSAP